MRGGLAETELHEQADPRTKCCALAVAARFSNVDDVGGRYPTFFELTEGCLYAPVISYRLTHSHTPIIVPFERPSTSKKYLALGKERQLFFAFSRACASDNGAEFTSVKKVDDDGK